jgi:hypothetical protein
MWTSPGFHTDPIYQEVPMPKYVIERTMPGAGALTTDQLKAVAKQSCAVLNELGPSIQWLHSYVTDDRLYCTYLAPGADLVREHAVRAGFPADAVVQVRSVIDPTTAE